MATAKKQVQAQESKAEATEAKTEDKEPKVNRSQKAAAERGLTFKGRGRDDFYTVSLNGKALGKVTRVRDDKQAEIGWVYDGSPKDFAPVSRGLAAEALVEANA